MLSPMQNLLKIGFACLLFSACLNETELRANRIETAKKAMDASLAPENQVPVVIVPSDKSEQASPTPSPPSPSLLPMNSSASALPVPSPTALVKTSPTPLATKIPSPVPSAIMPSPTPSPTSSPSISPTATPLGFDLSQSNLILTNAFKNKQSGIQVQGAGSVIKVLADDNDGSRHQRFILKTASGQTLLFAHNIDLAERIPNLKLGDAIEFFGEYEWNDQGGVIHWTHKDPSQQHLAGWLKYNNKLYQ